MPPAPIALLQMTSGIDPQANADTIVDAIHRARDSGAAMLFTPEMSGLLDRDRTRAAAAIVAEDDDLVLARVRRAAADTGVWVHLGSLALLRSDGRFANRGFVIDATGAIATTSSTCSTSTCPVASGGANRRSMVPATARWRWPPQPGCSVPPSATTCAFPTCTAR
jgi:predicted amidohydrolase